MNKRIYLIIYTLINIVLCHAMDMPKQLTPIQFALTMHTHPILEGFGDIITPADRRNVRAAYKPIWIATQMPEELKNCTTKQQTNSAFLAAIHYAPLNRMESHKLTQWLLDYRQDQQFSCYM